MFNFGFLELITLAVIGLIVLGPEQFPRVARGLLKIINELKRAFSEAKRDFDDVKDETEEILKKAEKEFSKATQSFTNLGKEEDLPGERKEKDSMEQGHSSPPAPQEKESIQKEEERE